MSPYFTTIRLGAAALIWADCPLGGAAAPSLHGALDALIEEGAAPLVIDFVRVVAIDDGLVAVLAAAASRAGHTGRSLELRLAGRRRFTVRDAAQLRFAIAQAYPTAA